MNICIIVDDYMPDSIKIAAKMMHELSCELKKQGHNVTVITPSFDRNKIGITELDEISILRFKSGKIKNVNKIQRVINESLLSHRAWKTYKKYFQHHPNDLIIYYSPSIFWGGLVSRLKKLWGSPSYLILRDIFPQWALDQGLISKGSLIEKYFRFFEKRNYLPADTIGLMSRENLSLFKRTTQTSNKLEVLYNWADKTTIQSSGKYRKELNIENKVVFFYGGNIGHAQDMMNIVRLAIKLRSEEKAHFVFVGAGDEVILIKGAIKKNHLNNITLLPPVSQQNFKQMLAEFDIGLFSLHSSHTTHNFPGKILGYMAQKLPILGSINKNNDLKPILETAKAGLISTNGDDQTLYQNALLLLNNPKYRKETGENAYSLLDAEFSIKSATQKILHQL